MVNTLILAAAGSGKTRYLVQDALKQSVPVLMVTYTIANACEIRRKFFELKGYIPKNITIQTWYSFLLQHGVKPFQSVVLNGKINGMLLVNEKSGKKYDGKYGPVYYAENDCMNFYLTKDMRIYSDKIAKFVCRCEERTTGRVSRRISRIFSRIYIDEVQDLAGYDLELIKSLMQSTCDVIMVGDPRQVTYHTHNEAKYKKYSAGKIADFIKNECKNIKCFFDHDTLRDSYRNNGLICSYSSKLYPEYGETGTKQHKITEHDGVFVVKPDAVQIYSDIFHPMQLRYNKSTKVDERYPVLNMGDSKGLTFERVLIYPTKKMIAWMLDNSTELKPKSRSQFYVAITRAKHSVGIVFDYDDKTNIDGVIKYQ